MSFKVTVMYPNKEDTSFNMEYYLSHHMPLAERIWKPFGFLKWELVEAVAELDGAKGPFYTFNVLTWRDEASYLKANAAPESSEIWDDLPNVCNHSPIVVMGNLVASG